MPDFDTRKPPQEPDRPNKLHLFVAACRQQVSAVVGRLGTSAGALLRSRNRISSRGKAFVILFVVVLGTALISWAVETPAEQRDQLNHKLRLKPPPGYTLEPDTGDSSAYPCDEGVKSCMLVTTYGDYDAKELASITRAKLSDPGVEATATSMQFTDGGHIADTGVSYCFATKDHLFRTLGTRSLNGAELLGTIDYSSSYGEEHCYIVVYEGHGGL